MISTYAQQNRLIAAQSILLYEGPGSTYPSTETINIDQPFIPLARNALGNWVKIQHADDAALTGWTLTGRLRLDDDKLSLGELPISDLPDAATPDPSIPAVLFETPILPQQINIPLLNEIYHDGQRQGNDPFAVVKVGDCNTASDYFLTPISLDVFNPGPYDHLTDVVERYGPSFGRESIAARNGFNVSSIFDPFWATSDHCQPDESPLACEYRHNPASVAFIMFGQNDVLVLNRDQYRDYLTRVVDESIERGVIPVLSTFTNNPENEENWDQIVAINVITIEVAQAYDIPLINFWLAARDLPQYGIGDDYAHLTAGGTGVAFTQGREAQFGLTLYNLAVLAMLDKIYHDVVQVYTYEENTRSS